MATITLRVLDGADRGRIYSGLTPPITIGREEGNTIQLNDERISRFHVKIQEDHENLVLTDLDSTNGTKVNGEDITLRILRLGDVISVGRSVLLFGSRDEIARRLDEVRQTRLDDGTMTPEEYRQKYPESALDFELYWRDNESLHATLYNYDPPDLPARLSPAQAAQLSELLEYVHQRLRRLLAAVKPAEQNAKGGRVTVELTEWQYLTDLQARLAEYLRRIGDPEPDDE